MPFVAFWLGVSHFTMGFRFCGNGEQGTHLSYSTPRCQDWRMNLLFVLPLKRRAGSGLRLAGQANQAPVISKILHTCLQSVAQRRLGLRLACEHPQIAPAGLAHD